MSQAFINRGTLLANGGVLAFGAGSFTNNGATIQAFASSTVTTLGTTSLLGGTLRARSSGSLVLTGSLSNLLLQVDNGGFARLTDTSLVGTSLSGTVTVAGNLQLGTTMAINAGSAVRLAANATLSGSGTLVLSGGLLTTSGFVFSNAGNIQSNATTTIAASSNSGTITSAIGSLLLNLPVNTGTIRALSGSSISLGSNVNNNGGIILVSGSSSLSASGRLIDGGQVQVANGSSIIPLVGSNSVSLANGTASIQTQSTLGLRNVTNSFLASDTSSYFFGSAGTLTNSVLAGQMQWGGNIASFTLNPTAILKGSGGVSGTLTFNGGTLVVGSGTLNVSSSSSFQGSGTLLFNAPGTITAQGVSLTIPVGLKVGFGTPLLFGLGESNEVPRGLLNAPSAPLNNYGTISADIAGAALTIIASTINNYGNISASNGGMIVIRGALNNQGTISNSGGVLALDVPNYSFSQISASSNQGVIAIAFANYNNAGSTLTLSSATTGDAGLLGTSITGGTIETADAAMHVYQAVLGTSSFPASSILFGTLDGVTLRGNMVVHRNAILLVKNTLTLDNAIISLGSPAEAPGTRGRNLSYTGQESIVGTGTITLNSAEASIAPSAGSSTLTLGPGVVVMTGSTGGKINAVNQGVIVAAGTGSTVTFATRTEVPSFSLPGYFRNQGTVTASNGASLLFLLDPSNSGIMQGNSARFTFSTLTNSGVVAATLSELGISNLSNSGTISLANGTVTLDGSYSNTGKIFLSDSLLNMKTYSPDLNLGDFVHSGPAVLSASITSGVNYLDLSNTLIGPADLGGANLSGSPMILTATSTMPVLRSDFGTLRVGNVILATDLTMMPGSTVISTSTTTMKLDNVSLFMVSAPGKTTALSIDNVSGIGEIVFNGAGGNLVIAATNTYMTIASGITIRTGTTGGAIGGNFKKSGDFRQVTNHGVISAETPGTIIQLNILTNTGTLAARNGGSLSIIPGGGPAPLSSGTLVADGGTISITPTGTFNTFTGAITAMNEGALILPVRRIVVQPPITLSNASVSFFGPTFEPVQTGSIRQILGSGHVSLTDSALLMSDGIQARSLQIGENSKLTIRSNNSTTGTSKVDMLLLGVGTSGTYATLDLTNNALILQTTDGADKTSKLALLRSALAQGRNAGDWLGQGITSSTVAVDQSATGSHMTSLAVFDNAALNLPAVGGVAADASSVFITTALIGDVTFDGQVNQADLDVIVQNWQTLQGSWSGGDVNFDGFVDLLDGVLVASRIQPPPDVSAAPAELASAVAALTVPEPSSLGLLAGISVGLLLRRRARYPRTVS